MGHFKRGKIARDRKMGLGRFGSEDRHRYRNLVADGELVTGEDYVEAWETGEFDNRLGTSFQGMDVPYKLNHHWDWHSSEARRKLKKKSGGNRKWFNAYAVRPKYKDVDRETIRYRGDSRAEELDIENLFGVSDAERSSQEAFERYLNYDPTPTTGVCKACSSVMTYKEARLNDSDICWECSMSIDVEMIELFLGSDGELSEEDLTGELGRLVESHEWIKRRLGVSDLI